jgi:hypothetical protein
MDHKLCDLEIGKHFEYQCEHNLLFPPQFRIEQTYQKVTSASKTSSGTLLAYIFKTFSSSDFVTTWKVNYFSLFLCLMKLSSCFRKMFFCHYRALKLRKSQSLKCTIINYLK